MLTALAALLLAAPVVELPASPVSVAVGDLDADGSAEIVVLLYWPKWGTTARTVSLAPGEESIEVVPALQERRELRVYKIADGRLIDAAPPLAVGPELLAIDGVEPNVPVLVLTHNAVARLVLRWAPEPALAIEPLQPIKHLFRSSARPIARLPALRVDGLRWVLLPTSSGFLAARGDGTSQSWPAPARRVSSGAAATMNDSLPQVRDVNRDGRDDLIDIVKQQIHVRYGAGAGDYSQTMRWDLKTQLERRPDEVKKSVYRQIEAIEDLDGDATLEVVVALDERGNESLRSGLKEMRGEPRSIEIYSLQAGGSVVPFGVPQQTVRGFAMPLPTPAGDRSAYRDLDGDGDLDYTTIRFDVGMWTAVRAATAGTVKLEILPTLFRNQGGALREINDAIPPQKVKLDLRNLSMARFMDFPGDLDGDRRLDLIVVDEREVRVHAGQAGGSFSKQPTRVIGLLHPVVNDESVLFRDLDRKPPSDLIVVSRPARGASSESVNPESDEAYMTPTVLTIDLSGTAP